MRERRREMTMTLSQQIITIAAVALATMLTRFLPFILFPAGKKTPAFVSYIGKVLPAAVFGLLVVYCLKGGRGCRGSAPEMAADARVDRGRNDSVYAACTACF